MDQSESGKFERIYQENSGSPVSLRVADLAIKNKDFKRAIEILEKTVIDYPLYPATYILLGKAYAGERNFKNSLQYFKKGSELLNSEATYQYYLREIEHISKTYQNTITSSDSPSDFSSLLLTDNTKDSEEEKDIDDNLISETLAKIYLTQGQSNEAVRVYKKLIKKYPLKKLYYESKIKDITSS